MRYPSTMIPTRPARSFGPGLAGFGFDFQSLVTGTANIASQFNSLLTGSSTSAIYQPTTVPLTTGTNLSNALPYLLIAGVVIYLWSGSKKRS